MDWGERKINEKSFGASLARLRIQRRLERTNFAPLAAKPVTRIERSGIEKLHRKTLEVIARYRGAPADQIETYEHEYHDPGSIALIRLTPVGRDTSTH